MQTTGVLETCISYSVSMGYLPYWLLLYHLDHSHQNSHMLTTMTIVQIQEVEPITPNRKLLKIMAKEQH